MDFNILWGHRAANTFLKFNVFDFWRYPLSR